IGTTTDDGASAIQVSGTARVNDQLGIGTAAVTTAPLAVRDGDIYGRIRIISAGINSAGWEIRTDKGDSASHGWSIFDRNAGATRISLDGSGVFSILNLSSGFVVASGSGALSSRL
ncbi:hypothetical protein ACR4XK_12135, partial [Glaesserella parasuis]|uniref:hypothetical protein n=1 Tax=Glaesserella parasuis TaxID=738 RepID=UPI003F2C046C